MKRSIHPVCLLLLSAALFPVAGCGGATPSGSAVIIIPPGDPPGPLLEIEPNDDAWNADYIGEFRPYDYVAIEGHINECCPDAYDGFAFFAVEPVEVIITLTEYDPGTDLDFALYDPYLDEFIAAWETDNHPEVGTFYYDGVGEFHIVIASYLGDSSYVLEVDFLELDPLYLLTTGSWPDGPEPDPLDHQRFRSYHVPPGAETSADQHVLTEGEAPDLALPQGAMGPGSVLGG